MAYAQQIRWSRRQILKRAAGMIAAPYLVPSAVFGKDDAVAPSNRITLGFIGIGAMGSGHLRGFLQYPETQIVAACDVDRWRREHAKKAVENAYATSRPSGKFQGCEAYDDLRDLLARRDIDAVVIATGDNWHALATVMAAKAGKDIYCEKPVSLTIREARAMIDTVRRYDRVFQTGLQQRSTPEFVRACKLVHAGAIGKVKYVYVCHPGTCRDVNLPAQPVPDGLDWDLWIGPAPRRPFNGRFHIYGKPPHVVPWHFCPDFGGGNLTSNTVHAFDVVQWGLKMDESGPVEIIPPETGQVPALTYKYADGVVVQVGWKLNKQTQFVPKGWDVGTRIQNFGALFVGEDGWIHVGRRGFLDAFPKEILAQSPAGPPGNPLASHKQNWLDCIKSRQRTVCDVAVGARSTMLSHLGCIALRTGRALQWDPAKEEFISDQQANRLRWRAMRQPWRI